jgi:prepilin-type N-terminal cleavage/methylation domain-containing protein
MGRDLGSVRQRIERGPHGNGQSPYFNQPSQLKRVIILKKYNFMILFFDVNQIKLQNWLTNIMLFNYHKNDSFHQSGFTLIEMSVVIVIASLMLTAFIKFFDTQERRSRLDASRVNLSAIENAISEHLSVHGFLPCPARRDSTPGDPEFGAATDCLSGEGIAGSCTDGICIQRGRDFDHDNNPATPDVSSRIRIGAVPARALNLPFDVMKDGWGNLITYGVTEKLATSAENYSLSDGGAISIVDESDTSVIEPPGFGSHILISHGPTGAGAIPFGSSVAVTDCPERGDAYDANNCNFSESDATFRLAVYSNAENASHFDDIVKYATKIAPAAGTASTGVGGAPFEMRACPNAMPDCPEGYKEGFSGVVTGGMCVRSGGNTVGTTNSTLSITHPSTVLRCLIEEFGQVTDKGVVLCKTCIPG